MNQESTNVELKDFEVHGGTFVSDPEKGKTEIPPKGEFKKESTARESDLIEITLIGKGFWEEIKNIKAAKESRVTKGAKGSEGGFEVAD